MQKSGDTAGKHSYDTGETIAGHAFALALVVSLVWHIFWLSSVRIFVSAPAVADRSGSGVSFIGSILEDSPVLSAGASGGSASDAEIKRLQDLFPLPRDLVTDTGTTAQSSIPVRNEKLASVSDFNILNEMDAKYSSDAEVSAKQIPEKPFDRVMVSYKTYPSEIEGPARFREVIYKPELPAYLRWDEGLGVDLGRMGNVFSIELKFRVSPEGKVESIERLSSSGHPTVDLIAIRYLKGWQFAPIKEGQGPAKAGQGPAKAGQEGTVKLNFSLSKAEAQ